MKMNSIVLCGALGLGISVAMPADARPATCLLSVSGEIYIDGPCDFNPLSSSDGSFQITGATGKYFAYVYVQGGGVASAPWNGVIGENRAHEPLGRLVRDGACWSNAEAKICAW